MKSRTLRPSDIVFGQSYFLDTGAGVRIVLAQRQCPDHAGNIQIDNAGMLQSVPASSLRRVPKVQWLVSRLHPLCAAVKKVAAKNGQEITVYE